MTAQPPSYEVHPDDKGQWVLYQTGGGDFLVVAWFVDREDAEFVRETFEKRAGTVHRPASDSDGTMRDCVTSAAA